MRVSHMQAKVSSEQDSLKSMSAGQEGGHGWKCREEQTLQGSESPGQPLRSKAFQFQATYVLQQLSPFTRVTDILLQEKSPFITNHLYKSPVGHLQLGIIFGGNE